jgi:molybdopterin-guanine dinucleotide biosynthesis protein A
MSKFSIANNFQITAIIMAGGKSRRMGRDKSMLPIDGVPAIKHVLDQLKPYFDEILISSNNPAEHSFDDVKVVADEVKGAGPLVGIVSALRVSRNDINFVVACDIPEVDIAVVRRMISEIDGFDAAIPQTGPSQYEPLFAVYKKSILAEADKAIASQRYRVMDPLENCKVKYVDLGDNLQFRNLNTMDDYRKFIGKKNNAGRP